MIVSNDHPAQDLTSYLRMALRRKYVIGLPIGASAAIAYLVASSMPPQYTAEAMLALDTRKVQVIQIDSVVSRLPQEDGALRTELDALSSRSMAARVAGKLDLINDPEFLSALDAPQSSWERLATTVKTLVSQQLVELGFTVPLLGDGPAHASEQNLLEPPLDNGIEQASATDEGGQRPEAAVATNLLSFFAVNWLLNGLRVSNDGRSFTIRVSFVSQNPELSTRVANAFAAAYLADQVDLQVKATQTAVAWLSQRLEQMRLELEASEAAVQRFRRDADLLEVSGTTTAAQQLSDLSAQLIQARNERLKWEARLQSINELTQDPRNADALADLVASPVIETLRGELARVGAEAEALRGELGPRHPRMVANESQLAVLNQRLADEVERARRNLRNEVFAARNREAQLEAMLGEDKGEYGEGGEAIVRLNQLQREAEANRILYESLLNRYKQTLEQEELATPEARLLSQAVPPGAPSGPRKLPVLLLGLVGGGIIGAALAAILEWRDRSIRRASEIEHMIGAPVFGVLPSVKGVRTRPEALVLDRPSSPFSEALRRALVAFQLSHGAAGVRVVMVTSATAGEGKTAFCVAAARALALTGVQVLVIDADLHRPRIAAALGRQASVHIGDVIRGRVPLEEAVCQDALSTARFLPAVAESGNPRAGLLDSPGFATLIERARERYDLVIVDTPPLLATTDAAAVGALADANLFLVRWGKTPRKLVMAALRFFSLCRIAVDGVIMTQVNLRRLASYDDPCETVPYRSIPYHRALTGPVEAFPPRLSEARFEERGTL